MFDPRQAGRAVRSAQGLVRIRLSAIVVTAALALALGAAPALANHSWGSYHWARTANPFPLQLGDNMTGSWDPLFQASMADWNASSVLNMRAVAGSGGKNCKASSGRVEVCNGKYGFNGWLGLAQIWISGSHIVQGVAKMNDSYLASSGYGSVARQHVLCQEVGHTFGLDHQDESGDDLDTCMDYDSALSNPSPNSHDYSQLGTIYSHFDGFNSYTTVEPVSGGGKGGGKGGGGNKGGNGNGNGLNRVSDDLWVEDLGQGRKRYVFVFWAEPGKPHGPPPGA